MCAKGERADLPIETLSGQGERREITNAKVPVGNCVGPQLALYMIQGGVTLVGRFTGRMDPPLSGAPLVRCERGLDFRTAGISRCAEIQLPSQKSNASRRERGIRLLQLPDERR